MRGCVGVWCRMPAISGTCMVTDIHHHSLEVLVSKSGHHSPGSIHLNPLGTNFLEQGAFLAVFERQIGGKREKRLSAVRARRSESPRFIPSRRASKPPSHLGTGYIPA